ncbi:hypothetical protein IMG5_131000 [Ichthyophthirius multifiliis]|uniref:Transmembrane protein n=1 Tax=Ichthyophthirius multifiliis TaxID=5932 RepID=G0QWC7_ICHMU|nr:hypothetical protein IMG5_131000 [Ichthyophthirius multifiliis]EGR30474.1 hypothetical protein IMG5_131000 [Ichthyophthirius multifiliis]|eukprot:XP_004032061.1 hypothetical protein IMG5_131000 [Ichthyophthirius multifiliis]
MNKVQNYSYQVYWKILLEEYFWKYDKFRLFIIIIQQTMFVFLLFKGSNTSQTYCNSTESTQYKIREDQNFFYGNTGGFQGGQQTESCRFIYSIKKCISSRYLWSRSLLKDINLQYI